MRIVHDVEAVRSAERAAMAALPEGALMQRAATGLARRVAGLLGQVYGARVVLLVGKGNNGGDALYAGARLAGRGARVDAVLVGPAEPPAALGALRGAGGRVHRHDDEQVADLVARADVVVDGLLGIGGKGGLRGPAASLVALAARSRALVVAVDVPSGVDAATGAVDGAAVRADVTVTFGTWKPGLLVSPGAAYAGQVECVDIGIGDQLGAPALEVLDADDVACLLGDPDPEADKYRRGVVGVVAGSEQYTGAAVLATGGALAAGAGMVRYVGTAHPADVVRARWPEAVVTVVERGATDDVLAAGRVQAWVVGPGLGTDPAAAATLEAVLRSDVPVLVDADGVTLLAAHPDWLTKRTAPTLLTPHAGEFARLLGTERADVEAGRLGWVRRAAADLGVTVLLKGATTLVADADGPVRVNPTGTPALATAGSGDVLAGAAGALLAAGLSTRDAGAVAAFLHGLAASLAAGQAPIRASDIASSWSAAVRSVRGGG